MYVKAYYVYLRCEEGVVYCLYKTTKALKQPYFSPFCKNSPEESSQNTVCIHSGS